MGKRNINIERLDIRIKGVPSPSAGAAVDGLGRELLDQLAAHLNPAGDGRTTKIDKLDSGSSQVGSGTKPAELRRIIAERVVASIGAKLK